MILKNVITIFAACALVAPAVIHAETARTTVPALITRFAPSHAKEFVIQEIPAVEGRDAYEIESVSGKVVLRGSSGVAQSSAFYHYLKEFCHAHVSWNGDNLTLPEKLPTLTEKIRVVSPVKHRLAYNYCTHGYTMPFWGKVEWAREIDWLALHGINRALIIQGQDAVWQNTFARFGYTKEEMRKWICSPAHQPWQFMQNIHSIMPPTQNIIDEHAELGRFIVERCRSLGIEPVLQGYYGMLPTHFKEKHSTAAIFPQPDWNVGTPRPDMLNPADPLFVPIANAFMEEQKKIYGSDILYYAADPFHEGGSSKGMDRGVVYKQIQDAILAFEPRATLVKQCWQSSNKEMFDAGNKDHSLALDLWCDVHPFWQNAKGYDGTPWGWCMLFNFGGNNALEADLPRLQKDFGAMLSDPAHGRIEATALVPEGSQTNPMVYELMTEMSWRGAPTDTRAWMNNYLHARYGSVNPAAESAWKTILATAYSSPQQEGSTNAVITGRPTTNKGMKGRTWAPRSQVPYEAYDLTTAWKTLLEAAPALGEKDTYQFDLADLTRQVLLNLSRPIFEKAIDAITAKDATALKLQGDRFLALLGDLEELTGTRRDWLMGTWVSNARAWGKSPEEKAYMDRAARMILTTWLEAPQQPLADYANREWNGLIGQYYAPRWKLFFECASADIANGSAFDADAFNTKRSDMDLAWVNSGTNTMAIEPKGDTVTVSKKLFAKYSPHFASYFPHRLPINRPDVIGAWKYSAEGTQYFREFREDGTVQGYSISGNKLDWFNGFNWTVENDTVLLKRGDNTIILDCVKRGTLNFKSEGFGEAVKAKVPGT